METEDLPSSTTTKAPPFELLGVQAPIVRRPGMGSLSILFLTVRSWIFNAFMQDVKIAELNVGCNSVSIGDRITYNDDQTPTAVGQLGMNTTTGRPRAYIGGATRDLLGGHEVVVPGGSNAFSADQSMGNNKLTNLAAPSSPASNDAARAAWVTDQIIAAIDSQEFADGVDLATTTAIAGSATLSGETLTADSNGAFPTVDGGIAVSGQKYLLKNESSTKNGLWVLTTVGDGSTPWTLTRRSDFAVGDAVHGKIVPVKEGATNGGFDFRCSSGPGSDVVGTDTISFTIRTVTSDHGGLTGLSDDDHAQYPLLAGRSSGQTMKGGTGASENLILESTTHGTKGAVKIAAGSILQLGGDDAFVPTTSGQGKVGTSSKKFAEVNATVVNMGDAVMTSPTDPTAKFVFIEQAPDHFIVVNPITGRAWDLLTPSSARSASSAELDRAVNGPGV